MIISGIQQIGVGVTDADTAYQWYRTHFGAGVQVFADAAVADKMTPYTSGEARERYAILALNMRGGGGFEIWQYTEREPVACPFTPEVGDLGIYAGKLKCVDAHVARDFLLRRGADLVGDGVTHRPDNVSSFVVRDLYGNPYEIVEHPVHFVSKRHPIGGVFGAVIGCSDLEASKAFYQRVLGYDQVLFETEEAGALAGLPGGDRSLRRCVLRAGKPRVGAFAPLLGPTEIELVQTPGHAGRKIFEGRDWGDQGFIHLCFDVRGMDALRQHAADLGAPFTVDSGTSFDMGDAAGRFAYCEDPDGALIEFVETHKLPVLKRPAFSLDLRKRDPAKALPRWMLRALEL